MRYAAIMAFIVFGLSGILPAQEISLDEAIKYLEENGYEYEIAYDEAVKELPEGATVFTPFILEWAKEEVEKETSTVLSSGYGILDSGDIQESYVYGDMDYPREKRLMLAAGYERSNVILFVGYKFKWDRNTTANEQNPGWTNITRENVCSITNSRFGQQNGGNLPNCSCTYVNPGYECYTSADGNGKFLLNYYSGTSACSQCDGAPRVFSVRFSVNPRVITYVWNGYFFVPVYVYLGWVGVLSDGNGTPFSPVWNLCNTNLYSFCEYI